MEVPPLLQCLPNYPTSRSTKNEQDAALRRLKRRSQHRTNSQHHRRQRGEDNRPFCRTRIDRSTHLSGFRRPGRGGENQGLFSSSLEAQEPHHWHSNAWKAIRHLTPQTNALRDSPVFRIVKAGISNL